MPDNDNTLPGVTVSSSSGEGNSILGSLASGLPIIGTAINAVSQGIQNKKNRKFAEHMYDKQRADALADWTMQNEYNSPAQQMARLKAGGLNPNLVYGSGAVATGGAVRGTSASTPEGRAPQLDVGALVNGIMGAVNLQMKNQQIDNLKQLNTVLVNKAALTDTQQALGEINVAKGNRDLRNYNDISDASLEHMRLMNRKVTADTDFTMNAQELSTLRTSMDLQKGVEQILLMRLQQANTSAERFRIQAQIDNIRSDTRVKKLSGDLMENGVTPSDNIFIRAGAKLLSGSTPPAIKKLNDKSHELLKWLGVED